MNNKVIRKRHKIEKPIQQQKWNKQIHFYHNLSSMHFLLGIAKKDDNIAGHDLTTSPSRNNRGIVKNKYYKLKNNPNPHDKRDSYLNKHLRKNIKIHYVDTYKKRLKMKKEWTLSKVDKKYLRRLNKNKIK